MCVRVCDGWRRYKYQLECFIIYGFSKHIQWNPVDNIESQSTYMSNMVPHGKN